MLFSSGTNPVSLILLSYIVAGRRGRARESEGDRFRKSPFIDEVLINTSKHKHPDGSQRVYRAITAVSREYVVDGDDDGRRRMVAVRVLLRELHDTGYQTGNASLRGTVRVCQRPYHTPSTERLKAYLYGSLLTTNSFLHMAEHEI